MRTTAPATSGRGALRRKRENCFLAAWILIVGGACAGGEARRSAPERAPRYRVEYATYFGGSSWEQPREIIPLPDGSAVIGGQTSSSDLAVTKGEHSRNDFTIQHDRSPP